MWARAPLPVSILFFGILCSVRAGDLQDGPKWVTGPSTPVVQNYFGMHIHRALTTTPWPALHFKVIRLWDTGTAWADLEPRKGEWNFGTLDRLVNLAAMHDVEVLLCFGHTPGWASSSLGPSTVEKKPEATPPASLEDWRDFVRKVATRYKGRIGAYEVWNEPNLAQYYNGDVRTMVDMTREASEIIHSVDPSALVVSPSATMADGLDWLRAFLNDDGAQYVNVIGYHFYVTPDVPEKITSLADSVKSVMADHHVNLPVWDTETGWSSPKTFDSDYEASAYVARALLLAWTSGISRFYWYAWDNRNWTTLNLTVGDDYRPDANAVAYDTIESWMLGKRVENCSMDTHRTWVCNLTNSAGNSYIFWNPVRKVIFQPPAVPTKGGHWCVIDLSGHLSQGNPGSVFADQQPRMFRFVPSCLTASDPQ
jgi:hypothetical protein